jgi:membrane protease subunit HflK
MRYLAGLAVLVFLASLYSGVAQVREGERVVVRRFGKVVATPGPGLWIGLPWGMDRIDRVTDLLRRVPVGFDPNEDDFGQTTPPGQLLTGDHNLVNVQVVMQYSIADREVVAFIEQADRADGLIAGATESILAEWIASRTIDDVLLQGKIFLPEWLVRETQKRIEPYRLGVRIHHADVAHLTPPREVKNAFAKVNEAQTAVVTEQHKAHQVAGDRLRDARTDEFRLEKEREAYVTEQLEGARAEAGRFEKRLEQYRRLRASNPQFLASIWWDEIGRLLARMKENRALDLLDNRLGPDGLDMTLFPPLPKK